MKKLLKPEEAGEILKTNRENVIEMAKAGQIRSIKLGKCSYRFRETDIKDKLKESLSNAADLSSESNKLKEEDLGMVYFYGCFDVEYRPWTKERWKMVKIGYTRKLKQRLRKLYNASPIELILLAFIEDVSMDIEKDLHNKFSDRRLRGEWFKFKLEPDDPIYYEIEKNKLKSKATLRRLLKKYQ